MPIDKIKLKYPQLPFDPVCISYKKTKGLYNVNWWGKNLYIEFNPSVIYNEVFRKSVGNFHLVNYDEFVKAWNFLVKDLKKRILPTAKKCSFAVEDDINNLNKLAIITEIHIAKNIQCDRDAKVYFDNVFKNMHVSRHIKKIIEEQTTVKFENKVRSYLFYCKNRQFKSAYKKDLSSIGAKGCWIRGEIQTTHQATVKSLIGRLEL